MSVENQTYLVKLWEELKNIEHKDAVKQVADLDDDDEIALEIKDAEEKIELARANPNHWEQFTPQKLRTFISEELELSQSKNPTKEELKKMLADFYKVRLLENSVTEEARLYWETYERTKLSTRAKQLGLKQQQNSTKEQLVELLSRSTVAVYTEQHFWDQIPKNTLWRIVKKGLNKTLQTPTKLDLCEAMAESCDLWYRYQNTETLETLDEEQLKKILVEVGSETNILTTPKKDLKNRLLQEIQRHCKEQLDKVTSAIEDKSLTIDTPYKTKATLSDKVTGVAAGDSPSTKSESSTTARTLTYPISPEKNNKPAKATQEEARVGTAAQVVGSRSTNSGIQPAAWLLVIVLAVLLFWLFK